MTVLSSYVHIPYREAGLNRHHWVSNTIHTMLRTVLNPKNLHNSSLWLSGPEPLVNYMNKEYFNIQKSSISSGNQIIFQKRGSSGFAHQMLGACDSLLLAVTNSRPFQSIASVVVFL